MAIIGMNKIDIYKQLECAHLLMRPIKRFISSKILNQGTLIQKDVNELSSVTQLGWTLTQRGYRVKSRVP